MVDAKILVAHRLDAEFRPPNDLVKIRPQWDHIPMVAAQALVAIARDMMDCAAHLRVDVLAALGPADHAAALIP